MENLIAYVFANMLAWFIHPEHLSEWRRANLREIAVAIADASLVVQTTECDGDAACTAAWLTNESHLESNWDKNALGRSGEIGAFQLMPPPRGRAVPKTLEGQAEEAVRRWNLQGPNGFTGERWPCAREFGICPLALNRQLGGALYFASHPFVPAPSSSFLAREP
jgi:GNAT superfamily N-acetyltransferase